MKGIAVINSKLNMPQLPAALTVSERLQRLGNRMYEPNIVLIAAPAGYGKTTLMITALKRYQSEGCRICWYRLDKEDRDLAVFYTHLIETLFPREEQIWEGAHNHLDSCGDILTQHNYLNALICQEMWAFHNLRPDVKTFIVFDDFQQVSDVPDIAGAISFFIDNLPEGCTVIISSRWETAFLSGKQKLENNVLEITRSELCFSEEELSGFIKKRYGFIPEPGLLKDIMRHTEGWPAGVVLISQMLSDSEADEISSILNRSGRKEPLFQYIVTEVLKTVDDRLLQFLVRAAILQEFTVKAAENIFGENQALQLLEQCEQKGLFVQKIFGEAVTYRFQSLFREALRKIQTRYLSAEELSNYHLKASTYYIQNRMFDQAIEHFIACGDIDSAVSLIARESARMIAFESVEQLRLWYSFLPEEVVRNNGYLLYIKSFIYCHSRINDALSLLHQAQELFQQNGNCAMQINTLVAMAHLYVERNDIIGIRNVHQQMTALSGTVLGTPLEGMLDIFNFSAEVLDERLNKAVSHFRRLKSLTLTDDWQWIPLCYSCVMFFLLGDLNQAMDAAREALNLTSVKRAKLLMGYNYIFYGVVLQLKDEQEALLPILEDVTVIGEKHNYKYMLGFAKRLAAFSKYRAQDPEGALELLEDSTRYFEDLCNQAMVSANKLTRCLWLCSQGSPAELLAPAKKALKALTSAPSGLCLHEIGLSIFGAIARESGEFELAEKSLAKAINMSESKGAKQVLCGSLLHMAKLGFDTGNQNRGEDSLRQAFSLMVDNKYVAFWDMHLPTLVEMAAQCVNRQIHSDYAVSLIARYFSDEAAEFLRINAVCPADGQMKEFTDSFLARYGLRDEASAPKISASLFGRFSISVNGLDIEDQEWKTKKVAGILKFLMVHQGQPVSRDRLMEVFWPGADKKSASMSLRAALYELKKVLRKYDIPTEGNRSLLKENRDSLAVGGSLLSLDTEAFLAYSDELNKLPLNKQGQAQRKAILERMAALYQGDLLEEDIYEDWTFIEREAFRSVYFRSVNDLAKICLTDGDNSGAEKLLLRALAIDRYNEEACLNLLRLYSATNQRSRAAKLYSTFSTRFEKDLGIKPDEKLRAVIRDSE